MKSLTGWVVDMDGKSPESGPWRAEVGQTLPSALFFFQDSLTNFEGVRYLLSAYQVLVTILNALMPIIFI